MACELREVLDMVAGDLHDGNPTSDAGVDVKGEVDGVRSDKIFAQLPYDALAVGIFYRSLP